VPGNSAEWIATCSVLLRPFATHRKAAQTEAEGHVRIVLTCAQVQHMRNMLIGWGLGSEACVLLLQADDGEQTN
jgi:hypothetical protein